MACSLSLPAAQAAPTFPQSPMPGTQPPTPHLAPHSHLISAGEEALQLCPCSEQGRWDSLPEASPCLQRKTPVSTKDKGPSFEIKGPWDCWQSLTKDGEDTFFLTKQKRLAEDRNRENVLHLGREKGAGLSFKNRLHARGSVSPGQSLLVSHR